MSGLSPRHFCRAFREAYHLSPHAYLLQARLRRAKQLIARGVPLSSAAAAAGFADQSHLHRHFRRATGTTPARYRHGRNVQDLGSLAD